MVLNRVYSAENFAYFKCALLFSLNALCSEALGALDWISESIKTFQSIGLCDRSLLLVVVLLLLMLLPLLVVVVFLLLFAGVAIVRGRGGNSSGGGCNSSGWLQ